MIELENFFRLLKFSVSASASVIANASASASASVIANVSASARASSH